MDQELIDYAGALDRLGGDAEFLAELLGEMTKQVDSQFEILKAAVQNLDYKTLHSTAHGLKGAAANLDITRLHHLFEDLEKEGREQNLVHANTLLEQIEMSNKELHTFIEKL